MSNVRISAFAFALSLASVTQLVSVAPLSAQSSPITRSVTSALQWGPCPAIFPTGCQIAVLNGDPSKANADVFLAFEGPVDAKTHVGSLK